MATLRSAFISVWRQMARTTLKANAEDKRARGEARSKADATTLGVLIFHWLEGTK